MGGQRELDTLVGTKRAFPTTTLCVAVWPRLDGYTRSKETNYQRVNSPQRLFPFSRAGFLAHAIVAVDILALWRRRAAKSFSKDISFHSLGGGAVAVNKKATASRAACLLPTFIFSWE